MTPPVWQQEEFDRFENALDPSRRLRDTRRLESIFNAAASAKMFRLSYEWAKAHGIRFFIDETMQGAAAYYVRGTGVVGLGRQTSESLTKSIKSLTHEIRHAYQDYNGLLLHQTTGSFVNYYIQTALAEADARAHELMATRTTMITDKITSQDRQDMYGHFINWFKSPSPGWYGERYAPEYANTVLGMTDVPMPTELHLEFSLAKDDLNPKIWPQEGINIHDIAEVYKIGVTYDGSNYLSETGQSFDFLQDTALVAQEAMAFYGHASEEQKSLVRRIHAADLLASKPAVFKRG